MEKLITVLMECIEAGGDGERAAKETREWINQGTNPMNIINNAILHLMDDIGERFSRLDLFLPDLVSAAEVAKGVKDEVAIVLKERNIVTEKIGTIVMGKVKGDVHDIGKNIVATLLEVNGFDVVDLGNDVDPYLFIETARKEKAELIGMSSLLTTSMLYMKETIEGLEGLGLHGNIKVIVGGGPVSHDWAMSIGADGYSADANDAVSACMELLNKGGSNYEK
ncbi:hypothetical protein AZF37_07315 [endosymbiont 'TC1' of Trimyema compressum]|uniref:cobalamin B12-binding domain-containing protein n=1 Tax=endosymbiont 'TC1' of Trimyema compressum TaxID=243899 RepID=UPI0007F0AB41|nr:cobalamin-dependent protein [endosymbiont 'TC1' of Trimyema compressum]AMP20995.1 hypothetical protein AZF37_07315 [endosymbiont 'TC1' of Trimyema compressum]